MPILHVRDVPLAGSRIAAFSVAHVWQMMLLVLRCSRDAAPAQEQVPNAVLLFGLEVNADFERQVPRRRSVRTREERTAAGLRFGRDVQRPAARQLGLHGIESTLAAVRTITGVPLARPEHRDEFWRHSAVDVAWTAVVQTIRGRDGGTCRIIRQS